MRRSTWTKAAFAVALRRGVWSVALGPPVATPEAPLPLLLPAGGLLAAGTAALLRRRLRR